MTDEASGAGDGATPTSRTLPRVAYRELDDTALMEAMRRQDERAIDEFLIRHQRLLSDRARQWRAALADVEDCITDVLEDIAVLIVNGRIRPTRSIAAYVVKSFRVQLALRSKREGDRLRLECDAVAEAAGLGERAVAATVSEGTMRASRGVEWQPSSIPRAISRLASMLDEGMSEEERRILGWLSNAVSQREICQWLGITYSPGTQRIWRLRERLRATAREHTHHFSAIEQIELERFFRRAAEVSRSKRKRRHGPDSEGAT